MKTLLSIVIASSLTGCAVPCNHCRQTTPPDIEHNETQKLDDGWVKHVETRTWIHYMRAK